MQGGGGDVEAEVMCVPPSVLLGMFVCVCRVTLLLVCHCIYVLFCRFVCASGFVRVAHASVKDE